MYFRGDVLKCFIPHGSMLTKTGKNIVKIQKKKKKAF